MAVGLTVDQASIRRQGSRIIEFKAFHTNSGGFVMSIGEDQGTAYSFSWSASVQTTYLFRLAPAADAVSLTVVSPAPGQSIPAGSNQTITADVKYSLNSQTSGRVVLHSSAHLFLVDRAEVSSADGTSRLRLDVSVPSGAPTMRVWAELTTTAGASLLKSTEIQIPVAAGTSTISMRDDRYFSPRADHC